MTKEHKKNEDISWGNTSESTDDIKKIKNISWNVKQYRPSRTFRKRGKILPVSRGICHENIPTTVCDGIKIILEQNMATKR